jgi:hypothetical protein
MVIAKAMWRTRTNPMFVLSGMILRSRMCVASD